jgi:2-polyprenyl-3-methyl-5-hydroxy-6-metoxy-1,4-benzoquinol methylase
MGWTLCGSAAEPAFVTTDRNRRVSRQAFRYGRCEGCGVVFLANPPADLARYYVGDYHLIPDAAELAASSARESFKLDILGSRISAGRIVDIGPSYGGFPYLAQRAGYDVTAIEVDEACCTFIESTIGARAIHSGEPEVVLGAMSDLDAVTLWHSIEHLGQPWRTLEAATRALRPGGALVVATPNPDGLEARLLGRRWVHVDAPRHLFLISPRALAARAAALGLKAVSISAEDTQAWDCNVLGWHHALRDLGMRGPVTPPIAEGITKALSGIERRPTLGSVYTSVFIRP